MLNSSVLVLNRSYLPVHITSVRRAFVLLYQDIARAIDEQYKIFDYESWAQLRVNEQDESIGLVDRAIRIPRVIVLLTYDKMPRGQVRFTRINIFRRDKNRCQYCGKIFPRNELSIDHVMPRSYGGRSTWENVVCACYQCNKKKGGRTPVEASMKMMSQPRKPRWSPFMRVSLQEISRKEWMPFLTMLDLSYWNTELLDT
jgi:5-methylcytosine-specific restriction endonuclease McrA